MTNSKHENWLPIKGYEGLYEVSDLGRVKSLPKYNRNYDYIMKPTVNPRDGRLSVILCKDAKSHKRVSIHRLVAVAFVSNPNGYTEVNHIDENPSNNNAENLEWCSRMYNMNYGKMKALQKKRQRGLVLWNEDGTRKFNSFKEAESNGYKRSSIYYSMKHGTYYKGYLWGYADEH